MKNKNFIKAFSDISPKKYKRDEILQNILDGKEKKYNSNKVYFKYAFVILALFMMIISLPKKDVLIDSNLSRSNIFSIEESFSFIYNDSVYVKSENNLPNNLEPNNDIISYRSYNEESNPIINELSAEKEYLGEYLFTIEDSSSSLFGAKIYKSLKDEKNLILLLNDIYEEYEILRNR